MPPTEKAAQLFATGYSCSQAVFAAHAEELGLPTETALKISAAFGGGLGRQGEVCGAVSGALMALGLARGQTNPDDKAAKDHTYALTRRFCAEFSDREGSLLCRELLGCQIGTPEGLQQAQEENLFKTVCPELVASASAILDGILKDS
jgi:C_GCAxxG_C_C family probable redox protein